MYQLVEKMYLFKKFLIQLLKCEICEGHHKMPWGMGKAFGSGGIHVLVEGPL